MVRIIILFGRMGSGKSSVSGFLVKEYGFKEYSYGDVFRGIATQRGLEHTRDVLVDLGEELRREDKSFLPKFLFEKIKNDGFDSVVLEGARDYEDLMYFKRLGLDLKVIGVASSDVLRYERLKNRGHKRDPVSFEEFLVQERREEEVFKISEVEKFVDQWVDNTNGLEELYLKLRKIMGE